jgi:hypothetical protein
MTTNATSNVTPEAGNPQQETLVNNITPVLRLLCISESLCYRLCNILAFVSQYVFVWDHQHHGKGGDIW